MVDTLIVGQEKELKNALKTITKSNRSFIKNTFIPHPAESTNIFDNGYAELLKESDAIIFLNNSEYYFTLIEQALKWSKHISINDLSKLETYQINRIQKLNNEAKTTLFIPQWQDIQPLTNDLFKIKSIEYLELELTSPSLFTDLDIFKKMLFKHIDFIFTIINSNLKKHQIFRNTEYFFQRNILVIRLDFMNGIVCNIKYLNFDKIRPDSILICDKKHNHLVDLSKKTYTKTDFTRIIRKNSFKTGSFNDSNIDQFYQQIKDNEHSASDNESRFNAFRTTKSILKELFN
jgi:hypothetical protein